MANFLYRSALMFLLLAFPHYFFSQSPPQKKRAADPQKQSSDTQDLGKSYAMLRPEQKRLVDDFVRHYNQTTGSKLVPEQGYDRARLSIRTTFDGVTHALLNAPLSDAHGKSLGHAIDLVDTIDEVMGEESGVGGDRQFRIYVYLKPDSLNILSRSQEFFRDRDNGMYHKGFPICYRLKNGPPSIQFSISRDARMSDIDVDYRSSNFPKALVNGHLTAANSDVRAGNNLERHDNRWSGLDGWWREVFGLLGNSAKAPKENATRKLGDIPLNPAMTAKQGIDQSAHDFLKSWVVDKQPNNSVAYFSRRSYACLEEVARSQGNPVLPGMVRLRAEMGLKQFSDAIGPASSVGDIFEAADKWSVQLKEGKNAFPTEFRLVSVPEDMALDEECGNGAIEQPAKPSKDKYFATAFRGKLGDNQSKVMSLLWTQEGAYWKIIAIRVEDSTSAGIVPPDAASVTEPTEEQPKTIAGDPEALKTITSFYQAWLAKRDAAQASSYASPRSYSCLGTPSANDKKLTPLARIRAGLDAPLARMPRGSQLSDMISSVQPVNEFLRPVAQENSKAFAMMGVPDQMADRFLCQNRQLPEEMASPQLAEAKYGNYYLSTSRLNYGEEESPALLLLWAKEKGSWKVVAWALEVP